MAKTGAKLTSLSDRNRPYVMAPPIMCDELCRHEGARTPFSNSGTSPGLWRFVSVMKTWPCLVLALMLASCQAIPIDQSGTLERISEHGVLRVGMITGLAPSEKSRLQILVGRSAAAAGGRPVLTEGAAEPLLLMLEAGELDVVVGAFDSSSPWSSRVHLLPPLSIERHGKSDIEATAAVRNGENGWIMLLEREAKSLSGSQ